jgi:cytoskeletal protein CcmA (bactofilin family)
MFSENNGADSMNDINYDNTTVLKEDAAFEGKLIFEGNVHVNGKFKGEIYSSGELMVGKTGYVEGSVEIGTIVIQGEVQGNIKASQQIVINSPATVRGDIVAPSLIIEEGAVFEGNCSMGNAAARASAQEEADNNVVDFAKTAEEDF